MTILQYFYTSINSHFAIVFKNIPGISAGIFGALTIFLTTLICATI